MSEAALFYELALTGLGTQFLADVQRAIDRLLVYPYAGEFIDSDLRRALLHRFPFSLIYAIEVDTLVIIAVAHHGRDPDYGKSRVN